MAESRPPARWPAAGPAEASAAAESARSVQVTGTLIGLFSFDIGYEIDLARARTLADRGETGELERRRAAPASLAYAAPPLRVPLGIRSVRPGDTAIAADASATIHDFGAVTISFQMPLSTKVEVLPVLSASLTGAGALEDAARALLQELYQRLEPAITRPGLNAFVEDYYVIHVQRTEPPLTGPELATVARGPLASALRCEASPLSESEIDDVFRPQVSYYPHDLVVTDWNVALVVDDECVETVSILEYLNVQLVELRFFDALLDARVADTYARVSKSSPSLPLLYRPYRRAIRELNMMRLDVATLVERVHNALKLSGDLYLAKLYTRTAERLGLRAWEESVAGKLQVLQSMYDVMVERVATARAEALELTIVLLIVVELGLFLAGWG
jgi:hypothetical protein